MPRWSAHHREVSRKGLGAQIADFPACRKQSGISSDCSSRKMIQMLQLWFLTRVMRFHWKLTMPVSDFPTRRNYTILIIFIESQKKKKKERILVSYTFLTHPAYVARINREIGGEWMFWGSSHTGISLEQATKPKIITTLVPCAYYPFCKPKGHWLTLLYPCRGCSSQACHVCSKSATGEGRGQGGQGAGKEVTAGGLVLAPTWDTDLVPQALLLQLFGASNPQHMISHAWKCLKLLTLSQHFLNEARTRPPGQQWMLQGGRWFNLSFHLFS